MGIVYNWNVRDSNELTHYGVLGMKWGVRKDRARGTYKTRLNSVKDLSKLMQKSIGYSTYTGLKSHDEVSKSRRGDCHSQVMYEHEELKKLGYEPKAKFFMEIDPKTGQGGQTHSFIYFKDGENFWWFENAWEGQEGLKSFSSEKEMISAIKRLHVKEQTGDRKRFSQIEFADFVPDEHTPGESLQELVNIVFKEDT